MAVTYFNSSTFLVKDKRLQVVADFVNGKTISTASGTGTTGQLVIGNSGLSGTSGVLATFTLPNPIGTISGGVLTLGTVASTTGATPTGNTSTTASLAEIRSGTGQTIVSGLTVGTSGSGADIIINATTISSGQTVTLSSGSITHG